MKMHRCAVACAVFLAILSRPLHGQDLEPGTWTSLMYTPGGEYAWAEFEVEKSGSEIRGLMKWRTGEVEVYQLRTHGDTLSFEWNPNFYMACRLARQPNRQFKGSCLDSRKNVGPAVLSPPGVELTANDVDFDKAFDVWNIDREEYLQERYPQPKTRSVAYEDPEPVPTELLAVGEQKFNVAESGSGNITVVLEAGVGDDHTVWQQVQTALDEGVRTVSYDRAGLGLSTPISGARTAQRMAKELEGVLQAGGYQAPYVLVGHAAASFTLFSFLEEHRSDVAGLVLVDPAHAGEDEAWRSIDADSWNQYVSQKKTFLSRVSATAAHEFQGYLDALELWENRPLPDTESMPVVVLSAQREGDAGKWIGVTTKGLHAKAKLHREMTSDLGGELIVVDESTSYIHLNDASQVVDAIKRVVDTIQQGR